MQVKPRRRREAEMSDWGSSEGERTEWVRSPATLSQREEQLRAEARPDTPRRDRPPPPEGSLAASQAAGHGPPSVSHPAALAYGQAGRSGVNASSRCECWQRVEQRRDTSGWMSAQRPRREEDTSMFRRPSRQVLEGGGRRRAWR
eukprot:scaffold13416_cov101-Isochrysis_galbana.AAC.1